MSAKNRPMFESRFQSFATVGGPALGAERIAALRGELDRLGLAGFLVPRADRFQNEYVPPSEERLLWLTGFSGSAGLAIVLRDKAILFVDGRYTVQAPSQVDGAVFAVANVAERAPSEWLEAEVGAGDRIGYDPWLHTIEFVERFAKACARKGASLVPVPGNPIDAVWRDRPAPPLALVRAHSLRLAGEEAKAKLEKVRKALRGDLLVSDPHNVAWLFNIRGGDVEHTPLALGYAFVPKEGRPTLFMDARKLTNVLRTRISVIADIEEPARLETFLEARGKSGGAVLFDAATASAALAQKLTEAGGKANSGPDPITLMKARKNRGELAGSRAAHERDGVAMARFLAWLDANGATGKETEISAAQALETFRRETGALKDVSFPSIAAAGPNAAIPHYRVSTESNRPIQPGTFFLIDSGGQYEDGTTDITRTIAIGKPTREMRDRFTRVLKGHIAIARAIFPKGVTGAQIDAFARAALWRAGLDFDHGTGHGVGSYLSVHEGPQRIAKTGTVALEPGMILSNEPGYYGAGRFGIRIENLIVVEPREIVGAEREMFGFETISFAPIDLNAIEPKLMDAEEIAWLNAYHAEVRAKLAPALDKATRAWLTKATRKLG